MMSILVAQKVAESSYARLNKGTEFSVFTHVNSDSLEVENALL